MDSYIKSAIDTLYSDDEDYIIVGLTGRTGSGCSTVAKIMQNSVDEMRHSLYNGNSPTDNYQRKQKIIFKHFQETWVPFNLIQVRSVITLMLIEGAVDKAISFIAKSLSGGAEIAGIASQIFSDLEAKFLAATCDDDPAKIIGFYTRELPLKCEEIKLELGEKIVVPLYQIIGSNIRISGSPFSEVAEHGRFFSLIQRVYTI
jgi:hypothetical protein